MHFKMCICSFIQKQTWGSKESGPVLSGGSFKGDIDVHLEGVGPVEGDPMGVS